MALDWLRSGAVSLLAIGLVAGGSGCLAGDVVRVYDGVERRERAISDVAYAAYVIAAEHEARGEYEQARAAYQLAVARDDESVDGWTRLAAVSCRLGHRDEAADAFDEAEGLDASFEPLWRERALCAERHGHDEEALAAAARAASLDPDRDETVLLYARLLARAKRYQEAAPWLRALSLRSPASTDVWQAIADLAEASGDRAWRSRAEARLRELRERMARRPKKDDAPPSAWALVDQALVSGDLPRARRELRLARLDLRWLAARAIAVGRPELAKREAELRVGAAPTESDVRVALALALDLLGERDRERDVLAALPDDAHALSDIGRAMMGELLSRHLGRELAANWLPAAGSGPSGDLVARLRARWAGGARP